MTYFVTCCILKYFNRTPNFVRVLPLSEEQLFFSTELIQSRTPQLATLLKKRPWHWFFPVNCARFLRTRVLQNTSERLFLFKWNQSVYIVVSNMAKGQISKHISHPYLCVSGGKKCSFFGRFGELCILVILVLRFPPLSYYLRSLTLHAARFPLYLNLLRDEGCT